MKLAIDVCAGKGGGTQAFRTDSDWHVLGIDNNPKMKQYWQDGNVEFLEFDVTVLDWEQLKEILAKKGFDRVEFLWASPPCERFSVACHAFPKIGVMKALQVVGACLEAVAILKPRRWVLENPRGRLRWFLGTPRQTIRYGDYDLKYPTEKLTDFWGNLPMPMPRFQKRVNPHGYKNWWSKIMPRDPIFRSCVPLGVSEAVKTATEAQS